MMVSKGDWSIFRGCVSFREGTVNLFDPSVFGQPSKSTLTAFLQLCKACKAAVQSRNGEVCGIFLVEHIRKTVFIKKNLPQKGENRKAILKNVLAGRGCGTTPFEEIKMVNMMFERKWCEQAAFHNHRAVQEYWFFVEKHKFYGKSPFGHIFISLTTNAVFLFRISAHHICYIFFTG